MFVNQIFLNSKQNKGIRIRSFILESYYNWINRARSGVLTKTSLSYKVRWFLSELLVVSPNSSLKKIGQLLELNKQKLLKQFLLTNMDTMVLNLKTIATKLKSIKSVRPKMEQLLKISESAITYVENYSFLRHLLVDSFDEEDEIINQHIALLDRNRAEVHNIYQEILFDGVQKHLEKLGEEDNSYYDILIADLQKNLKNVDKDENLLKKNKESDLAIAEFINDSNGGKEDIIYKSKNINILKKDKKSSAEKMEDFEYFILTEIEKVMKYSEQNILEKYGDVNSESKSAVIQDKRNKDGVKSDNILYSSKNQSDNGKNKVQSSLEIKEGSQTTKTVDVKFGKPTIKRKHEKKYADTNVGTTSHNTKRTSLQGIQQDLIENKIIFTDPLEEFKKLIWATNKGKVFQGKSRISDIRYDAIKLSELKYGKKYMSKNKDEETKPKLYIAKHIDDEL